MKEKDYISSIFRGWSKALNAKASERSWKFDNVSDLVGGYVYPEALTTSLKMKQFMKF